MKTFPPLAFVLHLVYYTAGVGWLGEGEREYRARMYTFLSTHKSGGSKEQDKKTTGDLLKHKTDIIRHVKKIPNCFQS